MLYLEAKIIYNQIKRKFFLFLIILLKAIRNEKIKKKYNNIFYITFGHKIYAY